MDQNQKKRKEKQTSIFKKKNEEDKAKLWIKFNYNWLKNRRIRLSE